MITAVDTNVLIDVLQADPTHGPRSREALRDCLHRGAVVACDVVWSEVAAGFDSEVAAIEALELLRIGFDPMARSDAVRSGQLWRRYRAGGGRRTRVVADFLIGSHAVGRADRLLTRDRGFYRKYFPTLVTVDPARA